MYLSKIYIKNFRGIKELLVEFEFECDYRSQWAAENIFDGCDSPFLFMG